jgi:competence protein ComGC
MNMDYSDLKNLRNSIGYQKLQALWAHEGAMVMNGLQRAAGKGQESAWRYYAGQMKGFELAIGQLERALLQMEKDGESEEAQTKTAAEIIAELRGEKPQ